MRIKFEERREYDANGGYTFTNESIALTAELVKEVNPKTVAGICSGGDLLFGAFAPVADQCVMVDHSLLSLKAALTKGLLIEQFPGAELKQLLDDAAKNYGRIRAAANYGYAEPCKLQEIVEKLVEELPPAVRSRTSFYGDPQYIHAAKLGVVWKTVTAKDLDAVRERLDNITVIHGDLIDMEGFPPFDLLYLSNAMEHTNFEGVNPELEKLTVKFLGSQSSVLFTLGSSQHRGVTESKWTKKHCKRADDAFVRLRHPEEMTSWFYHLFERKVEKETVPAT